MLQKLVILTLVSASLGQYLKDPRTLFESGGGAYNAPQAPPPDNYYKSKKVPPQIISHKQSQNHDGQFKYAFHAENGLAQGEVISPDGTRNGGYTYVDPSGKKIMVKYSAGKEGFRILESSDHIPKAIYSGIAAQPQQPYTHVQGQQGYAQQPQVEEDQNKYQSSNTNSVEERDPHYNDEPGKPYSFGNGFHFEFNG